MDHPLLTMQQAAQLLGYGRNKLFALLRDQDVLSKENIPRHHWVREGYFKVDIRQRVISHNICQNYTVTLVTGTGLSLLRLLVDEHSITEQRKADLALCHRNHRTIQQEVTTPSVEKTPQHF